MFPERELLEHQGCVTIETVHTWLQEECVCKTHAALQVPYEIVFRGWGEGFQQVKHLLLECKDQNSDPQNYAKNWPGGQHA